MQNEKSQPFITTLVLVVAIVGIVAYQRMEALPLISPLPKTANIFFDVIEPKLASKQNTYTVQRPIAFAPVVNASEDFDNATAYAVIDFTNGKVIASKNLDKRLPIASLTKIMTAVVALDLANKNDLFTVTKKAANEIPTKVGLHRGEQLTLYEALQTALMTSANDGAELIRDGIEAKYGRGIFISAMNKKAALLGLKNSSFANPQGFDDDNNYSSVADLAVLAHYAVITYPEIAEISQKNYVKIPANTYHRQMDLYNWNGLLGVYPDIVGLKIGNTDAAGTTTMVLSNRNKKPILAIVLGAPDIVKRDLWAAQLLDLAYFQEEKLPPVQIATEALHTKYASWKYWN